MLSQQVQQELWSHIGGVVDLPSFHTAALAIATMVRAGEIDIVEAADRLLQTARAKGLDLGDGAEDDLQGIMGSVFGSFNLDCGATTNFVSPVSFVWPEVDNAAFHGMAGEIVRTISPHSEADPVALLILTLTMAGNVIGRVPYYQVESDRHRTNLNIVLVGNTAKGRKGTSQGRIQAIVRVADQPWTDDRIKAGLSSGEGFIDAVRDPVEKYDVKEGRSEIVDRGVTDKRLMIVEPEFASAISVMEPAGTLCRLLFGERGMAINWRPLPKALR